MEFITNWWDAMPTFEKIFWGFAIPFSIVFIIQLIMTFIGMDHDGDVDIDGHDVHDMDSGNAFGFFTVKNFIVFFTIFGWTGVTCINNGLSKTLTIILATLLGIVMMFVVASIFYFMNRMVHSGTLKVNNAIGLTGEAYLPIPAKRGGIGKIQIKVQGSLREMEAMTDNEETIKTNTLVKVKDVLANNVLLVEKI